MRLNKSIFLSILFSIVVAGCGQSESYSGSYVGTETGTQNGVAFTQSVIFTISQNGDKISGLFSGESGANGGVYGTANGSEIKDLKIIETDVSCPGTLTGTASVSNGKLTASFKGSLSGSCGAVVGSVSATKSQ